MEGGITRSKGSRQKDDASKSKGHKSGSKGSATSSSKRSETSSVLKARAAAREAKLQVEIEALKQKEILEREELILRQRREKQERELQLVMSAVCPVLAGDRRQTVGPLILRSLLRSTSNDRYF